MASSGLNESPDDPVGYFLEDLTFHGRSERTRTEYERVLRQFEEFLNDPDVNPFSAAIDPGEATHRHCMAWVHSLRGTVSRSTVAIYASYVHRFYAYMTQVEVFDSNPMALVMEEMDESIEKDPERREISIEQMREFVGSVQHPLHRAIIVTLLKTGMRVGELCNLDLRDLALGEIELDDHDALGSRPQLDGRPDSLYIAAEPAQSEAYNGEERTASNKRKRATVVPVDDELRHVLLRWLAVRPDTVSPAEPLFVRTREGWGTRTDPEAVRHIVRTYAEEMGWYETGAGAGENVTPHYFRHFFTTHLRDRTGDRGIVKYLRGDVADDIIDTYTHNWGDRVRETYESSIYQLLD